MFRLIFIWTWLIIRVVNTGSKTFIIGCFWRIIGRLLLNITVQLFWIILFLLNLLHLLPNLIINFARYKKIVRILYIIELITQLLSALSTIELTFNFIENISFTLILKIFEPFFAFIIKELILSLLNALS